MLFFYGCICLKWFYRCFRLTYVEIKETNDCVITILGIKVMFIFNL